jgi:hypothetical protein
MSGFNRICACGLAFLAGGLLQVNQLQAVVLFSYDSTTGQFPTAQGWSAFDIDSTGPLTAPNVEGTTATNANAVMELFEGQSVLHIRDTLNDGPGDLPNFYYPWDTAQQQALIDNGLKFTMVFQGIPTTASGKGNVRFGFNGTEFEAQAANIDADRTIEVLGLSSTLAPNDGLFHTLEIFGQKNGLNYDFSYSFDGGSPTPLNIISNPAPSPLETAVYFGAQSSGGDGLDMLVKSVTMETLGIVPDQSATLLRTNNSSYGSLSVTNNAGAINVVGYSILSNEGALAPTQWTRIVDPNDQWLLLSNATDRDNLSEFEPDGDGVTIGMGQTINFGNVWIQNPTEDVSVELLLVDGSVVPVAASYQGNGGERFEFGDLDFDGDFDVADFTGQFVPGFGANTTSMSAAERYQAGDFNEDNVVNIIDFLIYNDAYNTANPLAAPLNASLLSVPEPAAWQTVAVGLAACLVTGRSQRQRSRLVPQAIAAGVAVLSISAGTSAEAADLLAHWKLNETAGAVAATDSTGGGHNATKVGGVTSGATGIIGNAWQFTGSVNDYLAINTTPAGDSLLNLGETFSITGWTKISGTGLATMFSISDDTQPSEEVVVRAAGDQGPSGFGSADVNARPGIGPGEAVSTTHVNDNQWHFISFTQNTGGWSLYVDGVEEDSGVAADGLASAAAIGANVAHIGINKDNTATNNGYQWALSGLIDDLAVWDDRLTTNEVRNTYLGGLNGVDAATPFTATLSLDVNESTGNVLLKNTSGVAFEIDAYRIRSADGSLTPNTWTSLDTQSFDANVWTKLGSTISDVSEGAFGESTNLVSGMTPVNLGALYDEAKNDKDLIFDYHLAGTDPTLLFTGTVNYVGGSETDADFNNDGVVNGRDFLIWQRGFGTGTTNAQGDANSSGTVDGADLTIWQNLYGTSSLVAAVQGVPEPSSICLVVAAVAWLVGRSLVLKKRSGILALAAALTTVLGGAAQADVFVDRTYLFGDDSAEMASAGITLGTGNGFGTTFDSANAPGSGDLQDLSVVADPTYVTVTGRPGATPGSLGASFDGVDDYVKTPINLAVPSDVWDNTTYFTSNFPLNFEGIRVVGMQLWVRPDSTRQNVRQDIIRNSNAHGISITASNNWGLVAGPVPPIDSGLAVSFDQWSHVMHVSGATNLASGSTQSGGALFVNGVIVKASSNAYTFTANHPLTIGAQQFQGDLENATPSVPANFFKGIVDDVDVFLWGTNTSNFDYGSFNAGEDNEWIVSQLAGIPAGDINRDGQVSGNGTGPVATDDVSALIQNFRSRQVIDGLQLGDWNSRLQGDLNFDGIVDLKDAFEVRSGLIASGLGTLDFSLLVGSVPEPTSATLLIATLIMASLKRRRHGGI